MKSKNFKIIAMCLIIYIYISIGQNYVCAAVQTEGGGGTSSPALLGINPESWNPDGASGQVGGTFSSLVKRIVNLAQLIGSGISVIVIAVISIKYMLGSVEDKAEYKKTMIPYVVGAVMVFSIVNILGMIESITNSVL